MTIGADDMMRLRDRAATGLLLALLAASLPGASVAREWKDITGQFSVEAEFVEFDGDNVKLRRSDGSVIAVPINKLSERDQRHLASLRSAKPTPGPEGKSHANPDSKPTPPAEDFDIVLVRNGNPVHNMVCLPNDQADPAAVLALKEYRALVAKAAGTEPVRVD